MKTKISKSGMCLVLTGTINTGSTLNAQNVGTSPDGTKKINFIKMVLSSYKITIFFLWFLCISYLAYSQNYKLFNASSKKLFTDSVNAYSIAFDSVKVSGNDSIYFNFFRLNNTLNPSDSCNFWGSQYCYKQNKPVWAGEKIKYDNAGIYQFYTLSGDTLNFNFTKNIGDTSLFYQDGIQKFFFVFEKADTLTTLNYFDSARFYKILHTDLAGNIINSQLNGEKIIIAKNIGLIQFFQIDSFPQILRPLYLIGAKFPAVGLYQLTNEMLYDYQPGDEIQFYDYYTFPEGPPWYNYSKYIKYVFLSKTITADSLIYAVSYVLYDVYASQTTIGTTTLKYYRHGIVAQIPFEYFNGKNRRLFLANYCGIKLWSYYVSPWAGMGYCSTENCWGHIDTGGPPENSKSTYVAGLGIYNTQGLVTAPPPHGYGYGKKIVYFKKNGIPCGNEVVMVLGPDHFLSQINVFPNPFSTTATLEILNPESQIPNLEFRMFDVFGKEFKRFKVKSKKFTINRENLPSGIYFYTLEVPNATFYTGKLIIE